MRFKELAEGLKEANYRVRMAEKARQEVLDLMVKAGMAKIVEDDDYGYEIYIIAAPDLLRAIQSIEMNGEDIRYFGIDENGYAEAKEQGCDPMDFWDEIVLRPGEEVEWYFKGGS